MGKIQSDFRFKRYKLPPEAFLIGPEREPNPTDLIDAETWGDIITLPDDVSLRTSEHHGTLLRNANEFVGYWIGMVLDIQAIVPAPREDALALACLNAYDDFRASIYTMLTGFYRQSFVALRMVLEEVLVGVYFRAYPDNHKIQQWVDGLQEGKLRISDIRKKLSKIEPYSNFQIGKYTLLSDGDHGWVSFLYNRLCEFVHRFYYTDKIGNQIPTSNMGLWGGSNGPVYEPRTVRVWSAYFFDTALLCLMLVGLAEEGLRTLEKPTVISFYKFLELVISWDRAPFPVAKDIVKFFIS